MTSKPSYDTLYEDHRRLIWALCYRMTGSAADADDLVQETFKRALEHPPARTSDPWRPWLVKVALNLGRDQLRRRRRQPYVGTWLPSPVEDSVRVNDDLEVAEPGAAPSSEARYELAESVTYAFLFALEQLRPLARAVLLLRDVFDYSVEETATALDTSQANVKTTHHRARRTMAAYDGHRCIPTPERSERMQSALQRLMFSLLTHDVAGLESLLVADVKSFSDGGGEFLAGRLPVLGRERVMRFFLNLAGRAKAHAQAEVRSINGLPALVLTQEPYLPNIAPRLVMRCEVDEAGRIREFHSVLATSKLTRVR